MSNSIDPSNPTDNMKTNSNPWKVAVGKNNAQYILDPHTGDVIDVQEEKKRKRNAKKKRSKARKVTQQSGHHTRQHHAVSGVEYNADVHCRLLPLPPDKIGLETHAMRVLRPTSLQKYPGRKLRKITKTREKARTASSLKASATAKMVRLTVTTKKQRTKSSKMRRKFRHTTAS